MDISSGWDLVVLGSGPAGEAAAMQAAKRLLLDYQNQPLSDALIADSCQRIADIRVSPEGQEGLSAFLEKRRPNWQRGD